MPVAEETTTWKAAVNPEESMMRFSRNVHALASGRSSAVERLELVRRRDRKHFPLKILKQNPQRAPLSTSTRPHNTSFWSRLFRVTKVP
jgi:hypothetical protein